METRSLQLSMSTGSLPSLPGYRVNLPSGSRRSYEEKNNEIEPKPFEAPLRKPRKTKYDPPLRLEPSWLKNDKQVLTYQMYFKEAVPESPIENYRVRHCTLNYHLENDTCSIQEPKESNSGILQGSFLGRAKLYKVTGEVYKLSDFIIGAEPCFHGRRFHIISCNSATRRYYKDLLKIDIGEDETLPEDPYRKKVRQDKLNRKNKVVSIASDGREDNLGQFIKYDRKVLKFNCSWDDTHRLYGSKNLYTLQYFLSDDTIQINSLVKLNNPFPLLLKRQKVVRDIDNPDAGFITCKDLVCGQYFDCFRRPLLLISCSPNTKKFYMKEYGMVQKDIELPPDEPPSLGRAIPPYNGFGSEADSLANCMHLIPKPNKPDTKQYMKYMGQQLTFKAELFNPLPEDMGRVFVLTYYLEDSTSSIYEPKQRNSGIVGGKFLERGKYKVVTDEETGASRYLIRDDFYVGNILSFMFYQTRTKTQHFKIVAQMKKETDSLMVLK